jgi:hypothetical protein
MFRLLLSHLQTFLDKNSKQGRLVNWGIPQRVGDPTVHLYLRRPEDDLTGVETCSPRFMYIFTINKVLC